MRKLLSILLVLLVHTAQAQTVEDCRTRLTYHGYNMGYNITITNLTTYATRYQVEYPSGGWISDIVQPGSTLSTCIAGPIRCGTIRAEPQTNKPCFCPYGWVTIADICITTPVKFTALSNVQNGWILMVTFTPHNVSSIDYVVRKTTKDYGRTFTTRDTIPVSMLKEGVPFTKPISLR